MIIIYHRSSAKNWNIQTIKLLKVFFKDQLFNLYNTFFHNKTAILVAIDCLCPSLLEKLNLFKLFTKMTANSYFSIFLSERQ